MIDMEKVISTISGHPAGDIFTGAEPALQEKILNCAFSDLASCQGVAESMYDDPFFEAAVAEQCIYLLRNLERLGGGADHIASESIEGAGSITYRNNAAEQIIAPRALFKLKMLTGNRTSISRG